MPGTVIDVVLVALALLFAVNGFRQGFVVALLSFAGFFGGALIGMQLAPWVANHFEAPALRVLASLAVLLVIAIVGQAACAWVGTRIRLTFTSGAVRALDDVGGALVSIVALLLVAWMVALPLASSSFPGLSRAIRTSTVLGAVDRFMPDSVRGVYDSLRVAVDTNDFPDVFGGLTPTRVREVPAPDGKLAGSAVVRRAERSVVKVVSDAPSCSRRIEGSGFVFAPQHVLTNAHVVAGTRGSSVRLLGESYEARVVGYDPDRDLAVLYVPGLGAPSLDWASRSGGPDGDAVVVGFPLDGPYHAESARIRDVRDISGPNFYESGTVRREVYTIRSKVLSGNSGGPLMSPGGDVYGVIFAAAADDPTTGYAVTADEATPVTDAGAEATRAVGTGACA